MNKSLVFLAAMFFAVLLMVNGSAYAASDGASAAQPASQSSPSGVQEMSPLSGKVIETMTSGGYTYVQIEKNGQKTWVAIPATKITVGQEVSFRPGTAMGDFESKTLNRKFDNIIFSSGLLSQAPMAHGTEMSVDKKAAGTSPAKEIKKAQGPNAYTVNELIKNSAGLDKQKVVVRGEVIKVSEKIMGKNWVHIVDNSGDPKEKLVVTSQDLPKVGDVVTVSGTLHKDKDFGSGYKYAVIIEDAAIK
jgi:hypothetical protein